MNVKTGENDNSSLTHFLGHTVQPWYWAKIESLMSCTENCGDNMIYVHVDQNARDNGKCE